MTEHWLVWGRGGHGIVVADAIRASGGVVVGWVDAAARHDEDHVVDESTFLEAVAQGVLPFRATHVALGIGDNAARWQAAQRLAGTLSAPVVHPTAWCSSAVSIGAGTVLLPRAVVHPRASIGRGVIVNTGAIVEHDCQVGDGAHLSPGAILTGGVQVGALAWVGAGAVVLPGRSIGRGAVVGAGAVVVHDVAEGVTVVGNPAKRVKEFSA